MNTLGKTPIPLDIPLALPAPEWLLVGLLVFSFLVHLLFVNLMVGGSILTFCFEYLGQKNPSYDRLARVVAQTTTVNKSLAVVMGVAPLLLINTLYTIYFYSANALTGIAWILVVPMVALAFLLAYLHKYSWDRMAEHRAIHLTLAGCTSLIFLTVPLIFLTNANLMLFPDRWPDVRGFVSALMLPNVWPRYFHFMAASLTASALFLVFYLKRKSFEWEATIGTWPRTEALKTLYTIAFLASSAQFIIGPLVFVTLPAQGISWSMNVLLLIGIFFACWSLYWLWKEISGPGDLRGRFALRISCFLGFTVVFMVSARHVYRAKALEPHQKLMSERTEAFLEASELAKKKAAAAEARAGTAGKGQSLFKSYCAACHAYGQRLVGPPLTEIQTIYAGNPAGIVSWSKAPGKKRDDYPQMPAMPLPATELNLIADYILQSKN